MGEHNHKGLGAGESIPTVAAGARILVQAGKVVNLFSSCQFLGTGELREDGMGPSQWGWGKERPPVPLISAAQVLEMQLCLECC